MKLKCKKKGCNYMWDYNGIRKFYSACPNCRNQVRIIEHVEKEAGEAKPIIKIEKEVLEDGMEWNGTEGRPRGFPKRKTE